MIGRRGFYISCVFLPVFFAIVCLGGQPATSQEVPPKGPPIYWVKLDTTKGPVVIEVQRAWSPFGADHFYQLVRSGFYDGCRFFRVVNGFMAQTGISGDPRVNAKWADRNIPDDKPDAPQSNRRAYVTFAKTGLPNSRSTQFFISFRDNGYLNEMGFTPFGRVISGMSAIDSLYSGYGEEPQSMAPRIKAQGNTALDAAFPRLDSIKRAAILTKKPR